MLDLNPSALQSHHVFESPNFVPLFSRRTPNYIISECPLVTQYLSPDPRSHVISLVLRLELLKLSPSLCPSDGPFGVNVFPPLNGLLGLVSARPDKWGRRSQVFNS